MICLVLLGYCDYAEAVCIACQRWLSRMTTGKEHTPRLCYEAPFCSRDAIQSCHHNRCCMYINNSTEKFKSAPSNHPHLPFDRLTHE